MNLKQTIEEMKMHGIVKNECFNVEIPCANDNFSQAMREFCNNPEFLPEYENVIKWLDFGNSKGIILTGSNGRGKTLIAKFVIPALLLCFHRRVVTVVDATQINDRIDELLTKKFLCIDDIGQEKESVVFGERRWAFPEICDNAEKKGNLLIITTNLDANGIEKKYGLRTRERIRAICKPVLFSGKSMRGNF